MMSVFTSTMAMANTSLLSDLYCKCTLWVTPHTVVGEEGRVEVTLPSLKHISCVSPVKVTEATLSVWTEFSRACKLYICLFGAVYTATLGPVDYGYDDIHHVVTIAGKEVVGVSADTEKDEITPHFDDRDIVDLTNYEGDWSPEYIHAMAYCVTAGEVGKVKDFTLKNEYLDEKYSLADIDKAIQILPVAANVWIFLEYLPKKMGVEQWKAAADSAVKMETIYLKSHGKVSEGWGKEIGRLITRAKKAEMENIQFQDSFVQGVLQGLGEEGAKCEEIKISWWSDRENEEMVKMMEELTWDNTWDPDCSTLMCVKK